VNTKNAARTAALIALPTPAKPEKAKESAGGWDPYEVWRTRVLLPRLDARLVQPTDRVPHVIAKSKR
jgi:hypothetical protein